MCDGGIVPDVARLGRSRISRVEIDHCAAQIIDSNCCNDEDGVVVGQRSGEVLAYWRCEDGGHQPVDPV